MCFPGPNLTKHQEIQRSIANHRAGCACGVSRSREILLRVMVLGSVNCCRWRPVIQAQWPVRARPKEHVRLYPSHHAARSRAAARAERLGGTAQESSLQEQATGVESSSQAVGAGFEGLGIPRALVGQLRAQGIAEPTAIQSTAIPVVLSGGDVGVRSVTGSGKTLAFLLPVLARVLSDIDTTRKRKWAYRDGTADDNDIRAVIVAPSQELAMQIVRVAQSLVPEGWQKAVQQLIGGANMGRQIEALRANRPLIVVGTPGRLAELDRLGKLGLHRVPCVVLDEVDQLLADNFRPSMDRIMEHAGKKVEGGRQTVVVSATLSPGVMRRVSRWTSPGREQPKLVSTAAMAPAAAEQDREGGAPAWGWDAAEEGWSREMGVLNESSAGGRFSSDLMGELPQDLVHLYLVSPRVRKVDTLRRAIHALNTQKALVFMNFGQRLKDTQVKLEARGLSVASLHGELRKEQRKNFLEAFRRGSVRVLLVTDVAARGLDIQGVEAVFNLELPSNPQHYVHRAGRAGRAGEAGVVVTIVEPREAHVINKLGKGLRCDVTRAEVKGGMMVAVEGPSDA